MGKSKAGTAILAAVLAAACASGCTGTAAGTKPSSTPGTGAASQKPAASASTSSTPSPTPSADPVKRQIDAMTLDEKIGQLVMVGLDGYVASDQAKSMVTNGKVGGFILYKNNVQNADQTTKLLNDLKAANAGNATPLFLSVDQEGGRIDRLPFTALPTNRAIGKVNNTAFSKEVGTCLGEELKAFGFNMDFAPVLDVDSNPHNPVIGDRSFGPAAALVSKLGIATMEGIRSQRIVPVVKHFPGHGDTSVDSHKALPTVSKSKEELKKLELIPFADAIAKDADVVMVAHILLPKLDKEYPSSQSKAIMTDLLRGELNFKGVVITDDMTMGAVIQNDSIGAAAVRSIQAGSDILLVAHEYDKETEVLQALKKSVQDGKVAASRIDESVYRILTLKRKYGLTDKAVPKADVETENKRIQETLAKYMPGR